jgi:hypothetical protein
LTGPPGTVDANHINQVVNAVVAQLGVGYNESDVRRLALDEMGKALKDKPLFYLRYEEGGKTAMVPIFWGEAVEETSETHYSKRRNVGNGDTNSGR